MGKTVDAERVLAIDIGTGTQDILLYDRSREPENSIQLVVPSPTRLLADRITRLTAAGHDLVLGGVTMGGGPLTRAVAGHMERGLKVYATPAAALSLGDDLESVQGRGVELVGTIEDAPRDAVGIRLGDVDLETLASALAPFDVALPAQVAVAVFDHGYAPAESNRKFRFERWRRFVARGGELPELVYRQLPDELTRMRAVQESVPGAVVMDTAVAAVWGGLMDPVAAARREEGVLALNLGNGHTVALLIKGSRVWGVFEHHTGRLDGPGLAEFLQQFRAGTLEDRAVYEDGGHGCVMHPDYRELAPFLFTAVTGPRRQLVRGSGFYEAAPFGDMMMAGPFGLLAGTLGEGTLTDQRSSSAQLL